MDEQARQVPGVRNGAAVGAAGGIWVRAVCVPEVQVPAERGIGCEYMERAETEGETRMRRRPDLGATIETVQQIVDADEKSQVRFVHVGTMMDVLELLKEKQAQDAIVAELRGVAGPMESTYDWRGEEDVH